MGVFLGCGIIGLKAGYFLVIWDVGYFKNNRYDGVKLILVKLDFKIRIVIGYIEGRVLMIKGLIY